MPPMTQSSVAVSADGNAWTVLNASPDIREQFAANAILHPNALRSSPMRSVVITNGDIDHIAGLLTLRERTAFTIFATSTTHDILDDNAVFKVLDPTLVERSRIELDEPFSPVPGLEVTAFAVPGKSALFMEGSNPELGVLGGQTVGLRIVHGTRVFHYIPGCAEIPDWLIEKLGDSDLLFFDGTVWENDDMLQSRTGVKTGSRMGHVAIAGGDGSLERLAGINARRVYTHINNTNPILRDGAPRRAVLEAGWEIAHDGMEIVL